MSDPYKRVQSRKLPSLPFRVLVVDSDELEAAQRKLLEATERKRRADRNLVPEKPERVKEAETAKRALSRADCLKAVHEKSTGSTLADPPAPPQPTSFVRTTTSRRAVPGAQPGR